MQRQCLTCGGVYETVSLDGTPYFHACAPETLITVTRAGAEIEVPIAGLQPDDLLTVLRDGARAVVTVTNMQPGDARIGERQRTRAEARNENIDPRSPQGARRVLAEGRGARPVDR